MSNTHARGERPLYPGNSFNPPRDVAGALERGYSGRCPNCGEGALFRSFLVTQERCPCCNEALDHAQVGSAVPLFVIPPSFAAAAATLYLLATFVTTSAVVLSGATVAVAMIVCFELLPRVAGALVALEWALWMHGFDPYEDALAFPASLKTGAASSVAAIRPASIRPRPSGADQAAVPAGAVRLSL